MPHRDPEIRRAYFRAYREKHRKRLNHMNKLSKRRRRLAAGFKPRGPKLTPEQARKRAVERAAKWNREHPEVKREAVRRRRARMAYRGRVKGPEREYAAIVVRDPCSYCGAPSQEPDHIVPVADGGKMEWQNLTGSCISCNRRKLDRPLLLFLLGDPVPGLREGRA